MYRFHVLGTLGLTAPDRHELDRVLSGDMRVALLTYLALGLPGHRRRDTLLAMLWPESDNDEARHRLRQLLYIVRSELGEDVLVTTGREQVGLNPARFWCDAVEFEAALRRGDLEQAQALYRGPLCDGVYVPCGVRMERWLESQRERLQEQALDSAWRLAQQCEADGRLREAVRWGARTLDLSPDEGRLRWLLSLSERAGDRVGAMRLFERFARLLAEEYDLEPSAETFAIIDGMRAGSGAGGGIARAAWRSATPIA